jgi:hypothetical protein
MQVTVDLPEQLARRLGPEMNRLAEIIEKGLQQSGAGTSANWREIIAFLARGPRPEEIIAFRPSEDHRQRSHELLDKNHQRTLDQSEASELEEMGHLNFLMMLLKAEARKIVGSGDAQS